MGKNFASYIDCIFVPSTCNFSPACLLMMEMDSFSGFSPYHSECMMLSVVVISFDIGQVFMLGCLDNENSDSHATFSYKQGFNIQFYEKWKLGKPFLLSHYMSEITMISVMWYNLQTIDRKHFLGSKYFPQSKLQVDRGFYMIYGLWHCHGNENNYTDSLLFIPWHFLISLFLYYDSLLLLCQSRRLID